MKLPIGKIIHGDCKKIVPKFPVGEINLVLTDPPYPDYHTEKYQYKKGMLNFLKKIDCRQIIFWSAKVDFPLNYTAIHIWDKWIGIGSEYERIFEINGQANYKLFRRFAAVGNPYRAKIAKDIHTQHPSQKPIKLMMKLVSTFSKPDDIILDPFAGVGSTCVASERMGRRWIGIEIDKGYCKIARKRIAYEKRNPGFRIFK